MPRRRRDAALPAVRLPGVALHRRFCLPRERAFVVEVEGAVTYLRPVSALGPGDHACLLYDDERRRDEVLLSYLDGGVANDEQMLYVPDGEPGRVAAELSRRAPVAQLRISSSAETYLPDGAFEPDRMLGMLRQAVAESRAGGYSGLRAAGEPPRSLTSNGSARALLDYERRVNALFAQGHMTGICVYDTRATEPGALLAIAAAHPVVIYAVRRDPRLRIHAEGVDRLALSGKLELATIGGLVGPLRDAVATGNDVEIDLADVVFIDVAGLRLLLEAAALLDERERKLTVASAPDWMPPILKMLDYDDPKGLVLQ